jgi:regulation of enolase protein 1 (concanavalin A-like superfamily)
MQIADVKEQNANWVRLLVSLLFMAALGSLRGGVVQTFDGKRYDGEASLEPGNIVSIVQRDSSKRSIPLDQVKTATFASPLMSMANFGQIADGWTNSDIGEVTIPGIVGQSNGLFTVRIGSGDIGGRADSFHFVHTPASGNIDLVARIVSISGADRLVRAGVMFRDSLRPEAKFAFAGITATGESALQYRSATRETSAGGSSHGKITLPCWLKLTRREKNIAAHWSTDGKQWQPLGVAAMALKDDCLMGLGVASHSALSFSTALIDSVVRTVPGVRGEYFADPDFTRLVTNRIDPMISFAWDGTPPVEGAPGARYSVRWTGEFEPQFSETYTFHADAGKARLWVNGEELALALFRPDFPTGREVNLASSAPLLLKAGNRYPFRFEYRHTGGRAIVRLGWSSQSQAKEALQARHLFCQLEARARAGQRPAGTNVWTMGRGILLRNGTFLAATVRGTTADGLKFIYRDDKEYTVPLHQVARAVFRISPRNALLSNPDLASGALLGNGDFVEGQIQFGHGRDVKVSSVLFGLKTYNLDSSDLAALVVGSPSPSGARYELRLADNSIIMADSLSVAPEQVSLVEPLLGSLQVPLDAVTEVRGLASRGPTKK